MARVAVEHRAKHDHAAVARTAIERRIYIERTAVNNYTGVYRPTIDKPFASSRPPPRRRWAPSSKTRIRLYRRALCRKNLVLADQPRAIWWGSRMVGEECVWEECSEAIARPL